MKTNRVSPIIGWLLSAWLAYSAYETIQRLADYYTAVPVNDYWRVVQHLRDYQTVHLSVLWMQHNEHRIIFPEIVFAIDMLMAHGRQILPVVLSVVFYAATWALLSFTVWRDTRIAGLVAGVVVFWQGSALVLARPFLLQWPISQLAVVVALFFLKKTADSPKARFLAVSILAAVVATYSSANALLLWPLLLVIGIVIGLEKRYLSVLGVAASAAVGLFFVGYEFSSKTDIGAALSHPFYSVGFLATYLSMPFGGMKSAGFGIGIGLLNLGIVLLLMAMAWRYKLITTLPAVVLFGNFVFTLLTILITTVGRLNPSDPHFDDARAIRYLTVPLLNWATVILICFWMSARLKWRVFTTQRLAIGFSLLLLVSFYKLRTWQAHYADDFAEYQLAARGMRAGLTDPETLTKVFPSPEFVRQNLAMLKKEHLTVFYGQVPGH